MAGGCRVDHFSKTRIFQTNQTFNIIATSHYARCLSATLNQLGRLSQGFILFNWMLFNIVLPINASIGPIDS
jgi:hypothetical protein